jgi:Recombinase
MGYGDDGASGLQRKAVEYMQELRAKDNGYPTIANILNAEGWPAPRGRAWYPGVVRGILLRHQDQGLLLRHQDQDDQAPDYLNRLPATIPAGRVLVHNHVRPTRQLGSRGFRVWLQAPDPARLDACPCGWAAELGQHYRVKGVPDRR